MHHAIRPRLHVLLVEDNLVDAGIARQAFGDSELSICITIVHDGAAATGYLHRRGVYAGAPRPDLVLLDLQLPKKNGREVLVDVKTDPDLCAIPVIVLSTSDRAEDIADAYRLHANAYITKPFEFSGMREVIRAIQQFWLGTAALPPS